MTARRLPLSERWLYGEHLPKTLRWLRGAAQATASPLWAAIVAGRRRSHGPTRAAPCPVVSVGALTVGGAGKTEVVTYVARVLAAQGIKNILIVSRGYGRTSRGPLLVSADATWQAVGDEPLMLAQTLPFAHLAVGEERADAIDLAWRRKGPFDVVLLDDGFQHLRLRRELDVVLVPPDVERLDVLPAGPLREPLSALSACAFPNGLVWVHSGDGALVSDAHTIKGRRPDVISRYVFKGLSGEGETPRRCALVTAVGRNQNVARLLAANQVEVFHHVALRDHDPLGDVVEQLRELPPDLPILTTHKDWPRLAGALAPNPSLWGRVRRVNIALEVVQGGAALSAALDAALLGCVKAQ